ncbi:AlpA family phage regulatory protein [Stenotrophomonas terrae]|uniref:helix-turn-helix transcriptional regulator n=1 Tax=Stenotrophomonas terrae TaxID=405446 RepID=UPI00320883CB
MSELQLLRRGEVMKKVGIGKSTLYKLIREGGFPPPVRVGASSTWVESEVDAWITARVQLRNEAA